MIHQPGKNDDLDFDRAFEEGTEDEPVSPKKNRRLWLGFVAVAFVIFEVTANPSLALAFGCIKFGWSDFARARRLKRDDPSRVRGKVCARFSAAWGLVKISLIATVLAFVIVCIEKGLDGGPAARPRNEPPPTFKTAFLLALAGFGLSAFVSSFAVISALRHGLKVWVGARENRAKLILLCAILTWVTAVGGVLLVIMLAPREWAGLTRNGFFLVMGLVMFGLPVMILVLLEALERRLVAKTPMECWGQLPPHLLKASDSNDWETERSR